MKQTLEIFSKTVARQIELYNTLHALLCAEREALAKQNATAVYDVLGDKEIVLAEIAAQSEIRVACVRFFAAAFDVAEKDVTLSYMALVSADRYAIKFAAYSSAFAEVITRVAELNFRNAMLVKKMFARTKELSGIIRKAAAPVRGLYGAKGEISEVSSLCSGVA
jgi:flagellar biosynthesis/type III secretory pathway chaperone